MNDLKTSIRKHLNVKTSGGRLTRVCSVLLLAGFLSACTVGPDFVTPTVDTGLQFKEVEGWKVFDTSTQAVSTDWWEIYQDPVLTGLMEQVNETNLTVAQAAAQFQNALALVQQASSALYPTLGVNADLTRSDAPFSSSSSGFSVDPGPQTRYGTSLGASWQLDLWGGIRRNVESNEASMQASAANLAGVRLSQQTVLATTYFQMRVFDAQKSLLAATVVAFERSLKLTENRYRAGVSGKSDVAISRTQLESTRAQLINIEWQRTKLENAIAVLLGRPPSALTIDAYVNWLVQPPIVPVGIPSTLLERRPDIARAERNAAAANAQIGVATAAWFPDLTLNGNVGFQTAQYAQLFTAPAQLWALGPALALSIFDGGLRTSRVEQARANFDVQAAAYRLTVLNAIQEVDNAMVQLRVQANEQVVQKLAVDAAREAVQLSQNQYDQGLVDFLSVAVLETTALNNERTQISLMGERLAASVQLISALGGGWSDQELANAGNPVPTEAASLK
jgi:NodT family efflux transporter outer membrane factor (OMF) lipoprotein